MLNLLAIQVGLFIFIHSCLNLNSVLNHCDNKRKYMCGGQQVSITEAFALCKQLHDPWEAELLAQGGLLVHGSAAAAKLCQSFIWLKIAIENSNTSQPHMVAQLVKSHMLLHGDISPLIF